MTLSNLYNLYEGCITEENTAEEAVRLNRANVIINMTAKALANVCYDEETENEIYDECLDICEYLDEKETRNTINDVIESYREEEDEEDFFENEVDYGYFM